jgi:hypothetical protein
MNPAVRSWQTSVVDEPEDFPKELFLAAEFLGV